MSLKKKKLSNPIVTQNVFQIVIRIHYILKVTYPIFGV